MSKQNKIYFGILVFVLVCIGVKTYFDSLVKDSRGRIAFTISTLGRIRLEISEYHNQYGEYPENLRELRQSMVESGDEDIISNIFHVGFKQVSDFEKYEVSVLDGTGGLYYNSKTGEIRVNLNEPVKYYKKFSPIKRNEIPSEW